MYVLTVIVLVSFFRFIHAVVKIRIIWRVTAQGLLSDVASKYKLLLKKLLFSLWQISKPFSSGSNRCSGMAAARTLPVTYKKINQSEIDVTGAKRGKTRIG